MNLVDSKLGDNNCVNLLDCESHELWTYWIIYLVDSKFRGE